LEVAVENGQLKIVREGSQRKFLDQVEQVSFSGPFARSRQHDVLFVTERAVFRLVAEGVELLEVAPGIDLETQILGQLDFQPVINEVRPMASHLFQTP
jgi:propionate CoA-transferase